MTETLRPQATIRPTRGCRACGNTLPLAPEVLRERGGLSAEDLDRDLY